MENKMTDKVIREARYDYRYREGMTPEQIVAMFNDFAKEYDLEALKGHACMSSTVIADYLIEYYKPEQRSEIKVLDVAAGTGALGIQLKNKGFVHIDALDPAEKMLEVAKAKDIYCRYICEFMDGRRIPDIATDSYDLLTVSAGFNIGLIPLKAFAEIIRAVKPGGLVVFAVPDRYQELGYKGGFLPFLSRLVEEGVWEKVVHLHLEDGRVSYRGSGPGTLFNYRVNVSEMTSAIP